MWGRSEKSLMKIGILGSGLMGANIGSVFAQLGHAILHMHLPSSVMIA